jgi:hypothetical protein
MDKATQRKIMVIAEMLPADNYSTVIKEEIKGEDLLLCGQTEVEGKPIDPEKTYLFNNAFIHQMNHYRRLKRSFLRNGLNGIKNYLRPYSKDKIQVLKAVDKIFGLG